MKTSLLPLQGLLYSTLSSYTALTSLITGVYDNVPSDAVFPYVTLGESTGTDWGTKNSDGENIVATLHCWSQYPGKKEAKQILDQMLQALSQPLSMSGFNIVVNKLEYIDVLDDKDGITKHGILRLRFMIGQ